MKEIKATFIQRIKRTPTVESFRFMGKEKIAFTPGQFLQVIFDEQNTDSRELNKYLSFSSSPTKEYIEVTKRISASLFSKRLQGLKTDELVTLKAALGSCILREDYKKIGFLIGGIGITPVISIIEYIIDTKMDTDVLLFYSNRTDEEIAFKQELDHWQRINCNLRVFYTVTDCPSNDQRCLFGHIDKNLVASNAADIKERVMFSFGPTKMVEAMTDICIDLGCKKEQIKTENFIGY